ncbi:MAG: MAPEG family protein [Dokdonella sp.]
MEPKLILFPSFGLVALTFLVWVWLYVQRLGEMKRERIDPQQIGSSAQSAARLHDTRASDNFRNLFELPVLLHVGVLVAFASAQVDAIGLGLAWAFVALRGLHSVIQCSYNRVMHRFLAYLAATIVLATFWGRLAWQLAQGT